MKMVKFFVGSIIFISILMAFPLPVFADEGELPDEAIIAEFDGKAQSYSLSCESRAASDWAAFWGVKVSESGFLNNLPSSDNPDVGFVGNVHDPWGYIPPRSYGVHAEPVAALLRDYGLQAEARRGMDWNDLKVEIAAGRPVIVWIIGQMWGGQAREYKASDGQVVLVAPYEHTMILYGYTPSAVNVVDSYSGRKQTYSIDAFLKSWSVLGNMAVLGHGIEQQPSTYVVQVENTYTVVRGDYLFLLAEKFNTDWKTLVAINSLVYPYTLSPGQVLKLPAQTDGDQTGSVDIDREGDQVVSQTEIISDRGIIYTVRPGDHLSRVAYQLGLNWQQLANYNNISFPYTIYPGQVLRWSDGEELADGQSELGVYTGFETIWSGWLYYSSTLPNTFRIRLTWPW
jgi:LysM repeat protein